MGTSAPAQRALLGEGRRDRRLLFADPHHRCLGSGRALPYSAHRGKKSVNREALDELKEQIPLMGYLHAQDWRPARPLSRGRWMGLCPLHGDRKPSFLVDANKDLFYCYGCGRGGDVIRFAELYHRVKFPQAVALLRQWRAGRQSLWPQPLALGAASPVLAGREGRPVLMGARPTLSGSDPRRGTVRLRRGVAGGVSKCPLLAGSPSQSAPVSPTVRWSPNRLSGLGRRPEWQRSAGGGIACRPTPRTRRQRSQSLPARGPRSQQLLCARWRCASVPIPPGGGEVMTFRVLHKPSNSHVRCPYRIVEQATGREIDWINKYLDYETLRRLADATLRTYAHELLHFLRWWDSVHHTDEVTKDALTESTLLDYVRFQSGQERELTGATINQRVAIVDRALRIAFPGAPGQVAPALQSTYWQRAPMGIGKPRLALSRLRVKTAKRTIVPLAIDEVARFWSRS